jgi:hypothetical protein
MSIGLLTLYDRRYVYKDTPYIALRIHINLISDYHQKIIHNKIPIDQ